MVAAAVAGVGGAAIAAATAGGHYGLATNQHGPSHAPQPSDQRALDVPPDALHGEYVESEGGGRFVTRVVQTGRLTAISSTAATARSEDGFSQSYVIREPEGAAAPPFSTGQLVTIGATRNGEANMIDTMRPPLAAGN